MGHAVVHCATSLKIAGSIPDGVIPFGRTMALGSTQPLTNEYQEYVLWVKAAAA
jgi:hypothetical protein